jgi:hypothetical protein
VSYLLQRLMIATMMWALMGAQAVTTVCSAQCVQHQAHPSSHQGAHMGHCGAAPQSQPNCVAMQNCSAHAVCSIPLLAISHDNSSADHNSPALAPTPVVAAFGPTRSVDPSVPLRSIIGDPPLITPLRV